MADLGFLGGFDANNVEPTSFEVLPAGTYEVVITNSAMKMNKARPRW